MPIIRAQVEPDSVLYTDDFYDTLDTSGFAPYRIDHGEGYVDYDANGHAAHINGIEDLWSQAKRHLRRYNGVPKVHFELFRNASGGSTTVPRVSY